MTSNNKGLILAIYAIAVAILTAVMFIILPERNSTFIISYLFTLLALLACCASSMYLSDAKAKNIPQDIAFLYTAFQYLIAEVIISIIALIVEYSSSFEAEIRADIYLLMQFTLLGIFLIRTVLLTMGKKHIDYVGDKAIGKVTAIRMMCSDVDLLKQKANSIQPPLNEEVQKELQTIFDALRFSDPMCSDTLKNIDESISDRIVVLDSALSEIIANPSLGIDGFLKASSQLQYQIKNRNERVRLTKGL